ncbi:Nucleoside-diphosphate-sugar epimerase [Cognatiyoonia koreensis]|uniref:Nucleoside-diphosphate-sugar epimerase n=1 Tax=Cognatiyoonia koreensis TaxID=364200 RepID=A0A1I0RT23_9RHOB|nr:NAD(P)-dependent oxidoreductase [Cognatiyoonia koreensis]SEW44476.1 Nucleoside-diphosphate-sugar epimerase [Cognatiyoonia koreensis]
MTRIMITGASGFLGQALLQAAKAEGHGIVALTRSTGSSVAQQDSHVQTAKFDLGAPDAVEHLQSALEGIDVVIHAAASFSGTAEAHARDTLKATENLLAAMTNMTSKPRLVLISSLSVYDVARMTDHEVLTEDSPMVTDASQRDVYAAAKAAQERLIAQYDGPYQIIRPGAIFGPHRLWSAQLGFARSGRVFCPGPRTKMPAISVDRAAQAILRAAISANGAATVNLIESNPPTCADWIAALGLKIVPVPAKLVHLLGSITGRGPAWQARFRPLVYDTTHAARLLEQTTQVPFKDQIARAKQAEQDSQ